MIWSCFPNLIITLLVLHESCGTVFKQERARVLYVNPKYVKDVTIFTFRERRNSQYLTTLNVTTLVPFGNNSTYRFELVNMKLQAFPVRFDFKGCDAMKTKWIKEWLETYSDLPNECPVPPGRYHIIKFELPPKNFPLQFNNVDYSVKCEIFVTATKEKICDFGVELRFSNKKN